MGLRSRCTSLDQTRVEVSVGIPTCEGAFLKSGVDWGREIFPPIPDHLSNAAPRSPTIFVNAAEGDPRKLDPRKALSSCIGMHGKNSHNLEIPGECMWPTWAILCLFVYVFVRPFCKYRDPACFVGSAPTRRPLRLRDGLILFVLLHYGYNW